jgi:hypothetical protein
MAIRWPGMYPNGESPAKWEVMSSASEATGVTRRKIEKENT